MHYEDLSNKPKKYRATVVLWDDGFHIVEDKVEFGITYDTPFQAEQDLNYINWLEEIYSPPRS